MAQVKSDSKQSLTKPVLLTHVFEASRAFTFATMRHVMISVWRDTPTAAALQRIGEHVGQVTLRHPKVASIIVMEALDFRAPDADARVEHARLTKQHERETLGVAMLVDGSSAKHSLYRFVLSTITLISAPTDTQKIFASANAAAAWLTDLDPSLEKQHLVDAVKEARQLGK